MRPKNRSAVTLALVMAILQPLLEGHDNAALLVAASAISEAGASYFRQALAAMRITLAPDKFWIDVENVLEDSDWNALFAVCNRFVRHWENVLVARNLEMRVVDFMLDNMDNDPWDGGPNPWDD